MKNQFIEFTRVISVKWLVISYFKRWRSILIAVLIGALVMGGFKALYSPAPSVSNSVVSENEEQIETNNKSITEFTKKIETNLEQIEDNEEEIADLQDDVELKTQRVADLEAYLATCEESLAQLQSAAEASPSSVELLGEISEYGARIQDVSNQIYELNVELHNSQRKLERLQTETTEELPEENETLRLELLSLQLENANLQAGMEPKTTRAGLKQILLYAFVGVFLGAFLIACWILAKVLLQNRLVLEDDLKECFGFYPLGSLAVSHSKRTGKLDLKLEKLAGERREVDEEAVYQMVAARLMAVNDGENCFVLTGTVSGEALERVRAGLIRYLPEDSTTDAAADPLHDADAALALKGAQVLLVEEKDVSSMKAILELVERLNAGNAQILGYVIV